MSEEELSSSSFFGGAEPAEAHHIHHVAVAVDFHRRCILRELETRPLSLGLLCGLLLFARGQLLLSDLGEALVKVECLCLRGLLGLRAQGGDFCANLLQGGPLQPRGLSERT